MEDVGGAIGTKLMGSTWTVKKYWETVVKVITEITGYQFTLNSIVTSYRFKNSTYERCMAYDIEYPINVYINTYGWALWRESYPKKSLL